MQPSRRYSKGISTIKALEKCTSFIVPAPALWETAGNHPLLSDMFRTHGNLGPTSRKKLPVLTASSNTSNRKAWLGFVVEIKVVTDQVPQNNNPSIASFTCRGDNILLEHAGSCPSGEKHGLILILGPSSRRTCEEAHSRPNCYPLWQGLPNNYRSRTSLNGNYLLSYASSPTFFKPTPKKGVWIYLNCLIGG